MHHVHNPRSTLLVLPPYSPDLGPLDFSCEDISKRGSMSATLAHWMIWRRKFRNIAPDMIQRAIANFNVRVAAVIQQRGAWIELVMYYCDLTAL